MKEDDTYLCLGEFAKREPKVSEMKFRDTLALCRRNEVTHQAIIRGFSASPRHQKQSGLSLVNNCHLFSLIAFRAGFSQFSRRYLPSIIVNYYVDWRKTVLGRGCRHTICTLNDGEG